MLNTSMKLLRWTLLPVKARKQITEQLSQFIFINETTAVLQWQNTFLTNTTILNTTTLDITQSYTTPQSLHCIIT